MNDERKSAERGHLDARFSEIRHALRNRFAIIRNANFYIRKRASKTEILVQDERVRVFFDLIDQELTKSDELLTELLTTDALLGPADPHDQGEGK